LFKVDVTLEAIRDSFSQKKFWKGAILLGAVAISVLTLWYTERFATRLREEEESRVALWADATAAVVDPNFSGDLQFVNRVLEGNTSIPVMLVDEEGRIMAYRNLSDRQSRTVEDLQATLARMKAYAPPISAEFAPGQFQYVYRSESLVLHRLRIYPRVLLGIMFLFVLLAYWAFSRARRAEQDRVWTGMARETAHQLGTPLSALLGWLTLLKEEEVAPATVAEMERDVERLQVIADRFSKMGTTGPLEPVCLQKWLTEVLGYWSKRLPISVEIHWIPDGQSHWVRASPVLLGWIVENLIRNAVDAMDGKGLLTFTIHSQGKEVHLDVTDTGKGMAPSVMQNVFNPGFTTKSRGWGLGLSLSKRIAQEQHGGKLVVLRSVPGIGTTFRLSLREITAPSSVSA
jgi:signal transduction histidine kinase